MQVRHLLAASFLAVAAAGAMSQELDPSETLQARNIAARRVAQAPVQAQDTVTVATAVQADEAPVATARVTTVAKRHFNQIYAKRWLAGDKQPSRQVAVGHTD